MFLLHIPESLLRRIWQERRFTTSRLQTPDGTPILIESPGIPNTDGGPDFVDAQIRIGTTTYRGDVELHNNAEAWTEHKHDRDLHYNRVILHVVLTADPLKPRAQTQSARIVPLLVLHPYPDDTLAGEWLKTLGDDRGGRSQRLKCADVNDSVEGEVIARWIRQLATERIELKVQRYEERLKQLVDESRLVMREPYPRYYGNPDEIPVPRKEYTKRDFASKVLWEQMLYEGIMEGLGYSKNTSAFAALARSVPLSVLRQHSLHDRVTIMALLFGTAGLLPSPREVVTQDDRSYIETLWKRWNQLRPAVRGDLLNRGDWLFFRLRPTNFPTARLAAMCFLLPQLFAPDAFRRFIAVLKSDDITAKERNAQLRRMFFFDVDEFWTRHYHFNKSSRSANIKLGSDRISDIVVNALIPVALLYARIFKDAPVRSHARSVLSTTRVALRTTMSETMQRQLIKDRLPLRTAMEHQGAIQLYRFYCTQDRCRDCAIGKRVLPSG